MNRFPLSLAGGAAVVLLAAALPAHGDIANNFSTNPLLDPSVLVQGSGAVDVNTRFTYNSADGTLTAHYDSSKPTIKLVFPLGQHVNQNSSFSVTTTFKIQSGGYITPPDFSSAVPTFGLINTQSTGDLRATTQDASFNDVTQGTAYNIMTVDYYPTVPGPFGGNSFDLVGIQSPLAGKTFNERIGFGYAGADLPFDQSITATVAFDALTHVATLNWGGGSVSLNMFDPDPVDSSIHIPRLFDMDAFAIVLWSDPVVAPPLPASPYGEFVGGDVVFDSFSVQVPEPASLGVLAGGMMMLLRRRAAAKSRA